MGAPVLTAVPLPLAVPLPKRMYLASRWSIITPSQIHLQGPSAEDSSAHQEAYWTYAELTLDCYHGGRIWSHIPHTSTVSQRQADPKAAESITKAINHPLSLPQDFLSRNQTSDHSSRQLSQAGVRHQSATSHSLREHISKPPKCPLLLSLNLV